MTDHNLVEGDFVKAVNDCQMENSTERTLKIGKLYEVQGVERTQFTILDEQGDMHHFDLYSDEYFVSADTPVNVKKLKNLAKIEKLQEKIRKLEAQNAELEV